jgi:hypothetical protein
VQEADEAKAVLNDEDPDVLDRAIGWMYIKSYNIPIKSLLPALHPTRRWREKQIKFHLDTYFFANRLFMEGLKKLILECMVPPFTKQLTERFDAGKTLQNIFDNTTAGDILRTKLVHLAFDNIQSFRHDRTAVSMFLKHEPLPWSLCQKFRPESEEEENLGSSRKLPDRT